MSGCAERDVLRSEVEPKVVTAEAKAAIGVRVACEIAAHKVIEFDGRSSCSTSHNTAIMLSTVIPYA